MRFTALFALITVGAAACGPSGPTPATTDMSPLAFVRCGDVEQKVEASPGPRHLFCAQIDVRDSGGSSRTLQLVAVSNSDRDPLRDRDVLIYHPGGPGISAVDLASSDPPDVDLNRYVIVAWDGTTASKDRGACGTDSLKFGTSRDPNALAADAAAVGKECLVGFTAAEDAGAVAAAEELETIRQYLGVDLVDILAISYGTAIAEAYLRLHNSAVRTAILDGPIALEAAWSDRLLAIDSRLTEAASKLAASCTTAHCTTTTSGGVPSFADLRRAVLAANAHVGAGNLTMTPIVFDQSAQLALRSESYWPIWASAVDKALAGDGTDLWALGEKEFFDLDLSVFYRSMCADIDRPSTAAAYEIPGNRLIVTYASALAPCIAFPRHEIRADAGAASGHPAVLIIASTHDVLTPASLLDSAPILRGFGTVCITDVQGHTSFRDPRIAPVVASFLEAGALLAGGPCRSAGT